MNAFLATLGRRWWLVPVCLVIIGGSAATNLARVEDPRPWAVGFAVAAALVLFAVDRWPLAVVAVGLLVAGYFVVGGRDGPIFFSVVAAAFLVALKRPSREWIWLVLVSAAFVWLGLLARGMALDDVEFHPWQATGVTALMAAVAAIASAVRSRIRARAEMAARAATEEQLRMAQDLHDGVGHGLAVIAMQSGVALHLLDRDPEAARSALEAIRETSRESLDALRAELSQLTSEEAPRTPRRGLGDLDLLVERVRTAGLGVTVTGEVGEVDDAAGEAAYAILQEALTNVLRHAAATAVFVELGRTGDVLSMTVTDDGRGGEVHDEGMGLHGMRERATALGGSLTAGPVPGGGFRVHAVLPVEAP